MSIYFKPILWQATRISLPIVYDMSKVLHEPQVRSPYPKHCELLDLGEILVRCRTICIIPDFTWTPETAPLLQCALLHFATGMLHFRGNVIPKDHNPVLFYSSMIFDILHPEVVRVIDYPAEDSTQDPG